MRFFNFSLFVSPARTSHRSSVCPGSIFTEICRSQQQEAVREYLTETEMDLISYRPTDFCYIEYREIFLTFTEVSDILSPMPTTSNILCIYVSSCMFLSLCLILVLFQTFPVMKTFPSGRAGAEVGAEGDQGPAGSPLSFHELPEAGRSRARAAVLPHCG